MLHQCSKVHHLVPNLVCLLFAAAQEMHDMHDIIFIFIILLLNMSVWFWMSSSSFLLSYAQQL